MAVYKTISKVLFAGYRPCFPFFIGGDGLVVHFMLQGLTTHYQVESFHLGCLDALDLSPTREDIVRTLNALNIDCQISDSLELKDFDKISYSNRNYFAEMVSKELFMNELCHRMEAFDPDIVITSEENAEDILEMSKIYGKKTILFINHAEMELDEIESYSKKTNLILYPSEFLANKYNTQYHCPTKVILPIYDWSIWIVQNNNRKYFSFLNPVPEKGLDIFLKIIEYLPTKNFLSQGVWYSPNVNFSQYPNLFWRSREYSNISNNMGLDFFLGNTKVLLSPSIWEDASPAILIQAMKNGIPVIGSCRGGIPEILGDAGIVIEDYLNPAAWVNAIITLDSDYDLYKALCYKSKECSTRFSYTEQLGEIYKAIDGLINAVPLT